MTTDDHQDSNSYQDLFQLDSDLIYLNHAAIAPWPRVTQQAVAEFALENARQGSLSYPQWLRTEQKLREQLCRLIGVDNSASIALVKNTSEALSFVAYGLHWQADDNVVVSNQEFPSNRIVWESLQNQGVEIRIANIDQPDVDPETALLALCNQKTRLISISSVQYASGIRIHLERLTEYCRPRNILVCVDAIQQAGVLPLNLDDSGVNFAMADGHKWMLGPEGLGFFYVHPDNLEQLRLTQFGWHMRQHPADFDNPDWEIANDAKRFECGSPNMLGIHALHASLGLIEDIGYKAISEQVLDNTRWLIEQLQRIPGIDIITPGDRERHAGIVNFRLAQAEQNQALFEYLASQRIFCALRGGGVRLSPHFYTPRADLESGVNAVAQFVKQTR